MRFQVTKQYGRSPESKCGSYKTLAEAQAYIDTHIVNDTAMRVQITYRIKEFDEIVQEFDSLKYTPISTKESSEDSSGSASGKGTGSTFNPTPLSNSPRPAGMPQNWSKDPNEDEDNKDK